MKKSIARREADPARSTSPVRGTTLLVLLVMLALVGSCDESPTGTSQPTLEQQVHEAINRHRFALGKPIFEFNEVIAAQARAHTHNIVLGNVPLDSDPHQGLAARIAAIDQTIPVALAAENVALNKGTADPVESAVQGWLASPPHRMNIEGNFDLTGIGVEKSSDGTFYFTQIFVKRR